MSEPKENYSVPMQHNLQPSVQPNSVNPSLTSSQKNLPLPKRTINQKITSIFRNIGILSVILLLVVSSIFAFIVLNPSQSFSQWITDKTPISKVFSLAQNSTANAASSTDKVANNLFGLNPNSDNASSQPTVQVIEKVLPSVLSINVRSVSDQSVDSVSVAGTGYVVDSDGLVVTNKHVISEACSVGENNVKISAVNSTQAAFDLKLISIDPVDDIAILKIQNPPSDLSPITFADSSKLKLGEETIAIGNVLGELQNTVTKGIVSGLNRSLDSGPQDDCTGQSVNTDGLIQTDAAINKGNSGGPLFNDQGQLIGMNTFGTTEAQNVGLAIPSKTITEALNSYKTNGQILRPRLGIYSRPITQVDKAQLTWLPVDYGELVYAPRGSQAVDPNSAAAKAGLQEGDIILEVNGQKIQYQNDNPSPLRRILLSLQPKQEIELTVLKGQSTGQGTFQYGSDKQKIKVVLGSVSLENGKLKSN